MKKSGCVYCAKCGSTNWYPGLKRPCWFYWMSVARCSWHSLAGPLWTSLFASCLQHRHFHKYRSVRTFTSTVLYALSQYRSVHTFTSTVLYALSHYRSVHTFTSTVLYALSQYRSVHTFTSTFLYALSQYRSVRTFTLPFCTHIHVRTAQYPSPKR